MSPKLVLAKEIGKFAAYAFVTIGLVGTARAQLSVIKTAWEAAK